MNISMNTCPWNQLVLGIVAVMVYLAVATNTGRVDEPWPMLLFSEPASDPSVVLLHQRANESLEKLLSARAPEQPL
jgi:hypothetical protein